MSRKSSGQRKQEIGQPCKSRCCLSRQSLVAQTETTPEQTQHTLIARSPRGYGSGVVNEPRVVWREEHLMDRSTCLHRSERLDPQKDRVKTYQSSTCCELPRDHQRGLQMGSRHCFPATCLGSLEREIWPWSGQSTRRSGDVTGKRCRGP